MAYSNIGVYGLGVMGSNLALNLEEKGYHVSVYNRSSQNEEDFLNKFLRKYKKGNKFQGFSSHKEFIQSIESPRKILIMIKSGRPVDNVIKQLSTHLEPGDILIDGGNSHFSDTSRRIEKLTHTGIYFIGMGISGGEHGARNGPSLMPGGNPDARKHIMPIFNAIAAKTPDNEPCCNWIGHGGAGHFVKMVHNGIEYADMQLLSEAYHFMKKGLGMDSFSISKTFREWNQGLLSSYLMEITADIFAINEENGIPLVEQILDTAGQKGTGKWTTITAFEEGIPLTVISEAVTARFISSFKSLRKEVSGKLEGPNSMKADLSDNLLSSLQQALLASRIVTLAEGFFFIKNISDQFEWNINPVMVSKNWRKGCIIQSSLLETITESFENNQQLQHLLLAPEFYNKLTHLQSGWRTTISTAVQYGIPMPALTSALNHFDSLRSEQLPANLIQAQRDYFGAHTYERIDQPRGVFFHTDWQKMKSALDR